MRENVAPDRLAWKRMAREHGLPLFLYAVLSVAVSWPAVRDFSSLLVSSGGDARNNLWLLWHVREVLAGNQALFDMPLLYYPEGINLLSRGLGPLVGLLALPFWPWGPEAAYNGTVLVSLILTGYCMFLLARSLGLEQGPAFFAGLVLFLAPLHLVGIRGHLTKVFLGLIPLTLLANHYAFDEKRRPVWAPATALLLLLTLLHNGYQFVFTTLAMAFLVALAFLSGSPDKRRFLVRRALLIGTFIVLLVGPLLVAMISVVYGADIVIDKSLESLNNQPDLVEFFLPPAFHRWLGPQVGGFLEAHDVHPTIETAVSLSLSGVILSSVALIWARKRARPWIALTALSAIMALGPTLLILGRRLFTTYNLPVILPYALLTQLPGLNFMRAPGRFMMLGYVAFALSAGIGLSALIKRWPRRRHVILLLPMLLLLLERWPAPWPQEALRPVPQFYQQIADDEAQYGVFDLPVTPNPDVWYPGYASFYQMYQMVHGKGIASGYLARVYAVHPVFPCLIPQLRPPTSEVTLDGRPVACYRNTRRQLAAANYRYVVFHKPQTGDFTYPPGSWGETQAETFIDLFFAGEAPIVDNELVTVYAIDPQWANLHYETTIGFLENWHSLEEGFRWAASPATLLVTLPEAQEVTLELTPAMLHPSVADTKSDQLTVSVGGYSTTVTIHEEERVAIPLSLARGENRIALSLASGNFRPSEQGIPDARLLSFAISQINLQTRPAE